MKHLHSLFCVLIFCLVSCSKRAQPSDPSATSSSWQPLRPTWLHLPETAPTSEITFFESLQRGFEQISVPEPTRPIEPTPSEVTQAARFIQERLPTNMPWRAQILDGAAAIIRGTLPVRSFASIESSQEFVEGTNPYPQYDGLRDRIVYMNLGANALELRAGIIYALAERAHLRDLAHIASVSVPALVLTYRTCSNLNAEFKAITHLQAMEAVGAWIRVDPDFHPPTNPPSLNPPINVSSNFDTIYNGFSAFFSDLPPQEVDQERLQGAYLVATGQHPMSSSAVCGRYIISRGPHRGQYLVPSDDLPRLIPLLNQVSSASQHAH